jgi:capsular polysaccharide export protein
MIETRPGPLIATSRAISGLPGVAEMLGAEVLYRMPFQGTGAGRSVIAWGRKPSARRAEAFAAQHGLPVLRIEDGFLRSVGLGNADAPLSLVVDDLGIYYDAATPSRLEAMVGRSHSLAECERAQALAAAWRSGRVSKYNQAREIGAGLPERFVLVVDQTFGDAAIRCGLADAASFARMLEAALDENPGATVLLKVHPDVFAGRKRGHFDRLSAGEAGRVQVLGTDVHPAGLLERAEAVYAVTSQMGFEGLLWGKPVRTFGMPFYAGWGLTRDMLSAPARRRPVPLESLVHGALVEYPRYLDPETGCRCEPERVVDWLALQRRHRERYPERIDAIGFSLWKRPIVRAFLQGTSVRFTSRVAENDAGIARASWGRKAMTAHGTRPSLQLEDGFLRSVGLGADLVRPVSWVIDRRGIYYDATAPSELEHILQTAVFDTSKVVRAQALRNRIVSSGLTKYNVGAARWCRPAGAARVILVPGQVESDASLAFGAPGLRRNIDLLRAVREANRDAYVVYKPHPDVLAGLRAKGEAEDEALASCDELVTDAAMGELLPQVDEVHVLTSLAGFEALLRGKRVTTWGQPFYAGWGLTEDREPVARRTRRLMLDELVAGVLIDYPTYVSRSTGRFTTPERALDELLAWRQQAATQRPWRTTLLRWFLQWNRR